MRRDLKLSFLGPQGSGKGTQAHFMTRDYGYKVFGMGDLLRAVAKQQTSLGRRIKAILKRGTLVPVSLTVHIIKAAIGRLKPGQGFIIDGFPRSLAQARALNKIVKLDAVIIFHINTAESVKRLPLRLTCGRGHIYNLKTKPPKRPGRCDIDGLKLTSRADDNPASIRRRLAVYRQKTEPVLKSYQKTHNFIRVNGQQSIAKVFAELKKSLNSL